MIFLMLRFRFLFLTFRSVKSLVIYMTMWPHVFPHGKLYRAFVQDLFYYICDIRVG
jgi:hypothetical protein